LDDEEAGAFNDAVLDTVVLDVTAVFDRAGMLLLAGRFAL
jgi:hypothetical protein